MSTQNSHLTAAKTAMLLHVPFFASLLLDMMKLHVGKFPDKFPPGNETAATDGKNIWMDEDFIEKLTLPELVFVLCHEVGHAMWQHMARGKRYFDLGFEGNKFDPRLWNVAGDYVINDMLVQAHIGAMPSMGLHDIKRATQSDLVDDVYKKLYKMEKDDPGSVNGDSMDVHILDLGEGNEVEWKRACKTAANADKAMGKLPGSLERFVDNLLNPQIPWQEKLRYHVARAISRPRDGMLWQSTRMQKPKRARVASISSFRVVW